MTIQFLCLFLLQNFFVRVKFSKWMPEDFNFEKNVEIKLRLVLVMWGFFISCKVITFITYQFCKVSSTDYKPFISLDAKIYTGLSRKWWKTYFLRFCNFFTNKRKPDKIEIFWKNKLLCIQVKQLNFCKFKQNLSISQSFFHHGLFLWNIYFIQIKLFLD